MPRSDTPDTPTTLIVALKDPATGKRLSGAAQRKRAELRKGSPNPIQKRVIDAPPVPKSEQFDDPFITLPLPPIDYGINAICSWASSILGVAVAVLSASINPKAALLVRAIKSLGRLTGRALRSEKALKLRQLSLGTNYDLTISGCPTDDLEKHAWAFSRLAVAIHDVAKAEVMDDAQVHRFLMLVDALSAFEKISADASFAALLEQINGGS